MSVIETLKLSKVEFGEKYVQDYIEANIERSNRERSGRNMTPDPLLMLMKNMTQRTHAAQPYAGILSASQEFVVFSHDMAHDWIEADYQPGERYTLIEIKVVDDGVRS